MTHSLTTRRFLKTSSLLIAGLVLAACGKQEAAAPAASAAAPSAPPPAAAAKVYVVGTDAAYAPFESQNEKGEIVGFDIDVVKAVAAKAGIEANVPVPAVDRIRRDRNRRRLERQRLAHQVHSRAHLGQLLFQRGNARVSLVHAYDQCTDISFHLGHAAIHPGLDDFASRTEHGTNWFHD